MNNAPKISIIVPVYNVEKYVGKCIESVISQTYKDWELILVDDGSTDNSGKICDEFALKDNRINVIHKENGGLSSARNTGLDIAKGEYITFIDSDDFIAHNTIEENIKVLESNINIDIVQYPTFYRYGKDDAYIKVTKNKIISGKEQLWYSYLINEYHCSVCDKIFKKHILEDIRFPIGITSEDIYILPELFNIVQNVYLSNKGCYYYIYREGSISKSNISYYRIKSNIIVHKKIYDECENIKSIKQFRIYYLLEIIKFMIYAKYNFDKNEYNKLIPLIGKCNIFFKEIIKYETNLKNKFLLLTYKVFGINNVVLTNLIIHKIIRK